MQYQWEYFGYLNGQITRSLTWEPGSWGFPRHLDDGDRFWVIPFTVPLLMAAKQAVFWDGTMPPVKPAVTVIPAQPPKLVLSDYLLTDSEGGLATPQDRDWLVRYSETWTGWGMAEYGTCQDDPLGPIMGQGLAAASPALVPVPNVMDSPNIDDEDPPLSFAEKDWSAISLAVYARLAVTGTWTTEDLNGNWCGTTARFDIGSADMTLEYLNGRPVKDKNGNVVTTRDPTRGFTAQLGYIVEGQTWPLMQLRITMSQVHSFRVALVVVAYVQGKPAEGVIPPDPDPTPIPQHQFPVGSSVTLGPGRGGAVSH